MIALSSMTSNRRMLSPESWTLIDFEVVVLKPPAREVARVPITCRSSISSSGTDEFVPPLLRLLPSFPRTYQSTMVPAFYTRGRSCYPRWWTLNPRRPGRRVPVAPL